MANIRIPFNYAEPTLRQNHISLDCCIATRGCRFRCLLIFALVLRRYNHNFGNCHLFSLTTPSITFSEAFVYLLKFLFCFLCTYNAAYIVFFYAYFALYTFICCPDRRLSIYPSGVEYIVMKLCIFFFCFSFINTIAYV